MTSPDTRDIVIDVVGTNEISGNVGYLGVAQFGSVLEWGSRGRRFESSHPDFPESLRIKGFRVFFFSWAVDKKDEKVGKRRKNHMQKICSRYDPLNIYMQKKEGAFLHPLFFSTCALRGTADHILFRRPC